MINVLVTGNFSEAEKARWAELFGDKCSFTYSAPKNITDECLKSAEIVIGGVPMAKLNKESMPALKLMQLTSAGADGQAAQEIFHGENAPALCNVTGAFGVTISEYTIGAIITLLRHFQLYRDKMHDHNWQRGDYPEVIFGKTALLLGAGDIGGNIAKRLKAFDCKVIAVKRTSTVPEYCDEVYTMDALEDLLPRADFILCSLPNSPKTQKLINEKTLAMMKPSAIIVNVGRGTLIDSDALAVALKNHVIGGAVLDVTDPEPLPADHPLWDEPNCLITPHAAGMSEQRDPHERIVKYIESNIAHYLKGEALENIVDVNTGYKVSK